MVHKVGFVLCASRHSTDIEKYSAFVPSTSVGCLVFCAIVFARAQFRVTRPNKLGSRLAIRSVLTPRNRIKTLPCADIEKVLGIRPHHLGWVSVFLCNSFCTSVVPPGQSRESRHLSPSNKNTLLRSAWTTACVPLVRALGSRVTALFRARV